MGSVDRLTSKTVQMRNGLSLWTVCAVATPLVIIVASIVWSLHHPFGVHWDEAIYLNQAQIDAQRLQHGMLLKLGGRILIKSAGRPPAYRILALPILGLFGFHTTVVRLVSIACFALSALFVYLAARRVGSSVAGGFATLIFCLSPVVVSACMWFGTEGPLYLATSAMLYYIFKCWTDKSDYWSNWVGLGLAIGIGLLAKASFVVIMLPVLAFWLAVGRRRESGIPKLAALWKAGLLALLVAGPWWLLNVRPAIAMTREARGFVANSLGPPSLATWLRWLGTVGQGLLGYGLSILIMLVVIASVREAMVRNKAFLDPLQRMAIGACACAGGPIILVQLTGTNHLLRHISPAMIPLAVVVGMLADWSGWARSVPSVVTSCVLFCAQLGMIVAPVFVPNKHPLDSGLVNASLPWRIMTRREQWNWEPLLRISRDCGVDSPVIAYLGMGPTFNPPQIERPWAAAAGSAGGATYAYPDVQLLWRYELGPLDWQKVMGSAEHSDIVVTAPHYVGELADKDDSDNQYNAEFAGRLATSPLFRSPISLEMGRFDPVEVVVFVKKSLPCQP